MKRLGWRLWPNWPATGGPRISILATSRSTCSIGRGGIGGKWRVASLLSHLLKWTDQPDHRSRGWRATVIEQRQELNRLAGRGVLRNHAQEVLADVYTEAVERAAAETGASRDRFPGECPYTLDELLTVKLSEADA